MTSNKPYILRAFYEWICDNQCTPYLYIETSVDGVLVPDMLKEESPLVLNISPSACIGLSIQNNSISFLTRFSGKDFEIYLPMYSVIGIVAKETNQGTMFAIENIEETDEQQDEKAVKEVRAKKKTSLKIVK